MRIMTLSLGNIVLLKEKETGEDGAGCPDMPEPAEGPHTPPQDPQMQ